MSEELYVVIREDRDGAGLTANPGKRPLLCAQYAGHDREHVEKVASNWREWNACVEVASEELASRLEPHSARWLRKRMERCK